MSQTKRPPTGQARTLEISEDDEVTILVDGRERPYTRLVIKRDATWRIDVHDEGEVILLESYDANGNSADVPLPDWLPPLLEELGWRGVEL